METEGGHLLSEPEPKRPHKSRGGSDRKVPSARENQVRIVTYVTANQKLRQQVGLLSGIH